MTDTRVAELLDELTPSYDDRVGDWERVAADARLANRRRLVATTRLRLGAFAVAVAVAATLVLAWPFSSQQGSVLDRALAAVGDGPVLHVILRNDRGGTLINLTSGERTPIYDDNEIWFDTQSAQMRGIERLGGVVQSDWFGKPSKPDAELAALAREYKQALESGTARIAGEDTIDGEPVVWVTIHSELLPDVADGKDHEWAQQVAVSKRTFKPVAARETRDGRPGPDTLQRVIDLQLIPRNDADFTPSRPSPQGTAFKQGRQPIELEQAPTLLGRTPLWLGRDYHGLPFTQAYREITSLGHQQRVRLTGAKAAAAIKCSQLRRDNGGDCFRALGADEIEVRPDGVFTVHGPIVWSDASTAVVFFYGTVGAGPSTNANDLIPLYDRPYLTVSETTQPSPLARDVGSYRPPPGSLFVDARGRLAVIDSDGIQVTIEGSDTATVVAAAKALTPLSG